MKKRCLKKSIYLLLLIPLVLLMAGCAKDFKGYASVDDIGDESKEKNQNEIPVNGVITFKLIDLRDDELTYIEGKDFSDIKADCIVKSNVEGKSPAKAKFINKDDTSDTYEMDVVYSGQANIGGVQNSENTNFLMFFEYTGLRSHSTYVLYLSGYIGIYDGDDLVCTIDLDKSIDRGFYDPSMVSNLSFSTTHSWVDSTDGTTHKCTGCDEVESHSYDNNNGKCVCGKLNPNSSDSGEGTNSGEPGNNSNPGAPSENVTPTYGNIQKSNKPESRESQAKNSVNVVPGVNESLVAYGTVFMHNKDNVKNFSDMKVLTLDARTKSNQELLANAFARSLGKEKVRVLDSAKVCSRNQLPITETGKKTYLSWVNLERKAQTVYAVCYNQTDKAYYLTGTLNANGTAVFPGFIVNEATNITIFVLE